MAVIDDIRNEIFKFTSHFDGIRNRLCLRKRDSVKSHMTKVSMIGHWIVAIFRYSNITACFLTEYSLT